MKKENRTRTLKRMHDCLVAAKEQGIVFPELPPELFESFSFMERLIEMLDNKWRTGLREVNPDNEDSPFHCSAEWHFARFTGDGASLAPLVYNVAFRVAGESNNFAASALKIARYLNVKNDYVYSAIELLVTAGFFEVIEVAEGKPTKYRPVCHKEWSEKHPGFCTKKVEKLFPDEDELGKKLFGILGGEKYFPNTLKGLRNTGATDEQIEQSGREFMEKDKGNGSKGRRKRFQDYLRSQHTRDHST
jgi:hypothetical protein